MTHSFPPRRSSDLVRATTAELRSSRGMFSKAEQAFARLDRAAADIEAAAASARTAIDGDGRKTFADVSAAARDLREGIARSEEHTSELQSLMRISYLVFCLKTTTIIYVHIRYV